MIGTDDYPAVTKCALRHRGMIASDEVRSPLAPLGEVRRRILRAAMSLAEELG
jgi:dihydrodipicolinate synthase/N-acetylneuraminate lyase